MDHAVEGLSQYLSEATQAFGDLIMDIFEAVGSHATTLLAASGAALGKISGIGLFNGFGGGAGSIPRLERAPAVTPNVPRTLSTPAQDVTQIATLLGKSPLKGYEIANV